MWRKISSYGWGVWFVVMAGGAAYAQKNTTLKLPFWDDFSFSTSRPDTMLWQKRQGIFVNPSLGNLPPSLNVASFDGLDDQGKPYKLTPPAIGATDALWSKPINLAAVPVGKRNTVILSYYWQMSGKAEKPDDTDFLRLEFKDKSGAWANIKEYRGIKANQHEGFTLETILIPTKYFHPSFQFRFTSNGNTSGPFDAWHIDYIYLNQDRQNNGTDYQPDRTVTQWPTSIFKNYTMIPYDIFFNFKPQDLFAPIEVESMTRDNTLHRGRFRYRLTNYYTAKNGKEAHRTLYDYTSGGTLPFEPGKRKKDRVAPLNYKVFSSATKDSMLLQSEYILLVNDGFFIQSIHSGTPTYLKNNYYNYRLNDTVRRRQNIHHTLAYDDGVAENAAGVNEIGGQMAIKFHIPSQDTLTAVDIYFPNYAPLPSGENTIHLSITKTLPDRRTSPLTTQQYFKTAARGLNVFTRFKFKIPAMVSGDFYVIFRQGTERRIPIGVDKNTKVGQTLTWFNVGKGWKTNQEVQGTLMIRPIFEDSNFKSVVTNLTPEPKAERLKVFPNPASHVLRVAGTFDHYKLYNLSGALVREGHQRTIHVHDMKDGWYILNLFVQDKVQFEKIIIRH